MSKKYAIILAGGKGLRLKRDQPKQFENLMNRPIIVWSLKKFNNLFEINSIIIVSPNEYRRDVEEIISKHGISKPTKIVSGGKTRQESSYNALRSMRFNYDDILIIHDAARPFLNEKLILECIKETNAHGASGVYIRAVDTIAEGNRGFIKSIPDRNKLYCTQTPQCFRYNIIKLAHENAILNDITNATDDAQLVIDAGYKIKIIEGYSGNIKITTPFDLEFAEFIAQKFENENL